MEQEYEFDQEYFEMGIPCEHCKKLFDLNDGSVSEEWHPNIIICEKCYKEEQLCK